MPTTRKKVIKTVYKNDEESEQDEEGFSYSSSDAVITDNSSSDEEALIVSSDDDFKRSKTSSKRPSAKKNMKKSNFKKSFMSKLDKQEDTEEKKDIVPTFFSVTNLTAADKLLPSVLNLSESDSSDDESETEVTKKNVPTSIISINADNCENETQSTAEYKDVWSKNLKDQSEEIAKQTFMELQLHKSKIEETKISIQNYTITTNTKECDVKDLLALGEEEILQPSTSNKIKKGKKKEVKVDTDSEMEDWEEVKEAKTIPQQGLQVIVDIPHACKKSKKVDVEMMMKRKINRVKKQHQVYMHKVHVLCWIGHGNYVSRILNDQTIMASALSLLPSKECYPGERVDMKYVEQITSWFKDKVSLKQDKHENKFRPKAPPLYVALQEQINKKTFSTKKYIVFVFVSMLRTLGLQCRVMFNFVTHPIKPPGSELCSLSTKQKDGTSVNKKENKSEKKKMPKASKENIPQLDGNYDMSYSSESDIMQLDGNDDILENKRSKQANRGIQNSKKHVRNETKPNEDDISPPKRARRNCKTKSDKNYNKNRNDDQLKSEHFSENTKIRGLIQGSEISRKSLSLKRIQTKIDTTTKKQDQEVTNDSRNSIEKVRNLRNTKNIKHANLPKSDLPPAKAKKSKALPIETSIIKPEIVDTFQNDDVSSKYFENSKLSSKNSVSKSRKRPKTVEPTVPKATNNIEKDIKDRKKRTQSTESKYFSGKIDNTSERKTKIDKPETEKPSEKSKRVSHRDLQQRKNAKVDVTNDLIHIIKGRVKEKKEDAKKLVVEEKIKSDSNEGSDYLPVHSPKREIAGSDDDFKPRKISPKPKTTSKKVDRRIISTDDESLNNLNKIDVWCEIFVEELEEWIAVDVIKGRVHCAAEIYRLLFLNDYATFIKTQSRASHPVAYVVGWDNNNYLKDLTRRYVPHWNTVTRKQRVEPQWWNVATKPWLGPNTARDREENERLDRMQLEAPLPKTIGEYKNHPLYALKRHLLKFEAIYPPDAVTLGFVRSEPVYARDCVYVCRSRDTWLKEAKVVKRGEQPYKVVKARPKWDKLSNKVITDKPLEVFGPWQVQDYEPPVAENGIVPRNAYGNVELFKECMLPKGTVHLKLSGLNRVAKKLNIDCAPAMTGFDFNGGWSHPVYDGYVVCQEYGEIITDAWIKDQEEQERKEQEKIKARVSKNWWKLARGLLIKERLKAKYGFEEPTTSQDKKKKGPRLVVKKK